MKVLLFAGSNNPESINRSIVKYAERLIKSMETTYIDLKDFELPLYGIELEKHEGIPENAQRLIELFQSHDAFVISVPEHNGSISAFFKNILDWLSRAQEDYRIFRDKPVLLFSTSPGPSGAKKAIIHAEEIIQKLGGNVVNKLSIPLFYKSVIVKDTEIRVKDVLIKEKIHKIISRFEAGEKQLMLSNVS